MNDTDGANYTITTQPISQIETDRLIELVQDNADWQRYCESIEAQLAEKDAKIAALEMALGNIADEREGAEGEERTEYAADE